MSKTAGPVTAVVCIGVLASAGGPRWVTAETGGPETSHIGHHPTYSEPDIRGTLAMPAHHAGEHRAVMLQHLESVQAIMAALVDEDFERARGIAGTSLGFAKPREATAQQDPAAFPPAYHDFAMAHHEAGEELVWVMPSKI